MAHRAPGAPGQPLVGLSLDIWMDLSGHFTGDLCWPTATATASAVVRMADIARERTSVTCPRWLAVQHGVD